MGRAPAIVGLLLALSTAILIALLGPLLLFNPWFVSLEQQRADVPTQLQASQQAVDHVTGQIVADLWTDGSFDAGLHDDEPLLTDDEKSHMRDVGSLIRVLGTLAIIAAVVLGLCILTLRHERRRIGRLLLTAAGIVGVVAVVLAAFFATSFDQAFLAFHRVFFPQGNFLFGPDSNLLRLFPEPFWFEAALAAGVLIVLSATLVSLVGFRMWRVSPSSAELPPA